MNLPSISDATSFLAGIRQGFAPQPPGARVPDVPCPVELSRDSLVLAGPTEVAMPVGVPVAGIDATAVAVAATASAQGVTGSLPVGLPGFVATQEAPKQDVLPLDPKKTSAILAQVGRVEFAFERFRDLPPADQDAFMRLASKLFQPGVMILRKPGTDTNLMALLARGALTDRDSHGVTLLDNLTNMECRELAPGFSSDFMRRHLIEDTLAQLAQPDRIKQGRRGTCTATTIEYLNARCFPSEYARIVSGLVSREGAVDVRGGDLMPRNVGLERADGSGRSDVSRIYQASVMDYANGPLVDYDNDADMNLPLLARTKDLYGLNKGLFAWEVKAALQAVTPFDYDAPTYRNVPEEREQFDQRLAEAQEKGQPVPVFLRWNRPAEHEFGLHMVLLERVDGDQVYLRNPQGDDETAALASPEIDLPNRETLGDGPSGGHIRMRSGEFFDRLFLYFGPRETHTAPDPGIIAGA